PSANAARDARRTASLLSTGSAPGRPKQIWLTRVFGAASRASLPTAANSFVLVLSCTWNSMPIVGVYLSRTSLAVIAALLSPSVPAGSRAAHSAHHVYTGAAFLRARACCAA